MYVGGVLVLLGQALYFRSRALLLYTVLWWVATHLFVVLYEEPRLASEFDGEYDEYRRAVPRYIPRRPA
jgi:protein-S-isoprenylcysteine O-methyltransferase Ste14